MDRRQGSRTAAAMEDSSRARKLTVRPGRGRHVAHGVVPQFLFALSRAQEIDRATARGLKQPRAEGARVVKRPQIPIDTQPDVLLHILAVVTHQALKMPERARAEPLEEPGERGARRPTGT